jgi:hypothetical protein
MSLRPRYSLLTLLILTALVAGGVKLWYGSHRVVISKSPTATELDLHERIHHQNIRKDIAGAYIYLVHEHCYMLSEREQFIDSSVPGRARRFII